MKTPEVRPEAGAFFGSPRASALSGWEHVMGLHGAECRDTFVVYASLSLEKRRLRNAPAHIAHRGWVAAGSGPAQDQRPSQ